MDHTEQKKAAKAFVERWESAEGSEDREARSFWIELCQNVIGIANPTTVLDFERKVKGRRIDVFFEDVGILIENKSRGVSLDDAEQRGWIDKAKGIPRMVTPFEQAKWYADNITPRSIAPKWVLTCNFDEIRIYDLDNENAEANYESIALIDIPSLLHRFSFFTRKENSRLEREKQLSIKAGEVVGRLYDAFASAYRDIENDEEEQRSLNILITRMVFLLYAEDSELLQHKNAFYEYLLSFQVPHMRQALIDLFAVLKTPEDERDPYLDPALLEFPYVNGGLFEQDIIIPQFTLDTRQILLDEASVGFEWSNISPTIFGAVFESTLNPETRRAGGMHYTSIENIHKVIDPLFLDDLRNELTAIEGLRSRKERDFKLNVFRKKIAGLKILDPACGSGNFLTETYLSLRKLENRVLENLYGDQMAFGLMDPIQVSINQFYGIEINDFAVEVAKTALWIAELQMLDETREILNMWIDALPLKSNENIHEGNALRMDWNNVLPAEECNFICGNPPFIGQDGKTESQREDMELVWGKDGSGYLDYVTAWYRKAAGYYRDVPVGSFAFVSTNSICQGQPVAAMFKPLFEEGWRISFAWPTFVWTSEALDRAHVHVVIVGMDRRQGKARLFGNDGVREVDNINPYLAAAPTFYIEARSMPLSSDLKPALYGEKPADGGFLQIKKREEYTAAMADPIAAKYVRRSLGATELINAKERWCLWLVDATDEDIAMSPYLSGRVDACRSWRLESKKKQTRDAAQTPHLFGEIRPIPCRYLCLPRHFSGGREFFTADYIEDGAIPTDACFMMKDEDGLAFAILTSSAFMLWQNTVGGRLKSDCRFANTLVWNTFPVPQMTDAQRAEVIEAGQAVLNARRSYEGMSLAKLYDPKRFKSFTELVNAHTKLDKAVYEMLGLGDEPSEGEVSTRLVELYSEMASE